MLAIIPTYEVIVDPDTPKLRRAWRVPQTDLETFISVLLFNGAEDFRVIREENGMGS